MSRGAGGVGGAAGGQNAGGVSVKTLQCVLGEAPTSLSLSFLTFLMNNTCVTLLMDILRGLGDQDDSLG